MATPVAANWCAEPVDQADRIHVYPLFGREHVFNEDDPLGCWCHPEYDCECPRLVVHNVAN